MAQDIVESAVELAKRDSVVELKCFVCGKKTGCNECEYLTDCEQRTVSKYCICKECSTRPSKKYYRASSTKQYIDDGDDVA